jgi:hypothetical protein
VQPHVDEHPRALGTSVSGYSLPAPGALVIIIPTEAEGELTFFAAAWASWTLLTGAVVGLTPIVLAAIVLAWLRRPWDGANEAILVVEVDLGSLAVVFSSASSCLT